MTTSPIEEISFVDIGKESRPFKYWIIIWIPLAILIGIGFAYYNTELLNFFFGLCVLIVFTGSIYILSKRRVYELEPMNKEQRSLKAKKTRLEIAKEDFQRKTYISFCSIGFSFPLGYLLLIGIIFHGPLSYWLFVLLGISMAIIFILFINFQIKYDYDEEIELKWILIQDNYIITKRYPPGFFIDDHKHPLFEIRKVIWSTHPIKRYVILQFGADYYYRIHQDCIPNDDEFKWIFKDIIEEREITWRDSLKVKQTA